MALHLMRVDDHALVLVGARHLQGRVAGESIDAIAGALHLGTKTISNYPTLIRQKLGLSNAVELLRQARQHRLFVP